MALSLQAESLHDLAQQCKSARKGASQEQVGELGVSQPEVCSSVDQSCCVDATVRNAWVTKEEESEARATNFT